jgi:large subunit ribosomal protein L21
MYAIVEIAGQQFKVAKDDKIFVNRLKNTEGESIDFDLVYLVDTDKKVNVGTPLVKGAKVTAKVLTHLKGDKVIVFKKNRRKGYRVKNGYRPSLTHIQIEEITA